MSSQRLVVKHNYLIEQLRLNWYAQPAIAQKLVAIIISMIYNRENKLEATYKIPFKDLYHYLNLSRCKDANRMVRKACKSLNSQPIIEDRKHLIYWFSSLEFLPDGMVEFEFSNKLAGYLVDLKGEFTKYRLYNVLSMKKAYPIRMYEILKQYETIKERTLSVEELRGLLGVTPGKYPNIKDLKKRVIDSCRRELSRKTDIGFNYYPLSRIKGSKKITHFRFTIYHNPAKNRAEQVEIYKREITGKRDINYTPGEYEIPEGSKNTAQFNSVYKTFMDQRDNFPADWGFKQYIEQYAADWKIVDLEGGGRDLQPTKIL